MKPARAARAVPTYTGLPLLPALAPPTVRANVRLADETKTAVCMLRGVNTRGEKGRWSDMTAATVAG